MLLYSKLGKYTDLNITKVLMKTIYACLLTSNHKKKPLIKSGFFMI
ncbi:hypothetical protein JCM19298_1255 [Nonlabens ulvanivorans]|nr:hypothetical protein JCM19298_1255 [Nonlabens ulvanivorans]